nr:hypothetical protein [Ktedonobacteraceae bacterium]
EVEGRLALEKQATQPMRRDQILRQQKEEPILEGNLPPADLPNPYEPVHSEETGEEEDRSKARRAQKAPSLLLEDGTNENDSIPPVLPPGKATK